MSTGQEAVLFSQEGNHRAGFALAMHYKLYGITIYGISGLTKGDEQSIHTPIAPFTL